MSESELIPTLVSAWLFWLLIAGSLAVGLLRFSYPQRFSNLIRQPFRANAFDRGETKLDFFNATLDIWAVLSLGLIVTLLTKENLLFIDWTIVLRYSLIIGLFLTFQGLIYQLAGYMFEDQAAFSLAWREKSLFLRWTSIWITPLLWWLSFGSGPHNWLALISTGILIVLYIWALGRMANTLWKSSSLKNYHNLLYLCALEMSPVLIFILLVS